MFCQSAVLNTLLFLIPAHTEPSCICLFNIALGLCLLNCFVLMSECLLKVMTGEKHITIVYLYCDCPGLGCVSVRRFLLSKHWSETRNKTSFNLKRTVHLCNIWLQIMKGTCKKAKEAF